MEEVVENHIAITLLDGLEEVQERGCLQLCHGHAILE
jgi:hypothetical protein